MAARKQHTKVDHRDEDRQPGNCTEPEKYQLPGQLQRTRPHVEDVSFADLPRPWLKALVADMGPDYYRALLPTCQTLTESVLQHSTRLTLRPHKDLQHDSNRRAIVQGLAAKSSNVCLHIDQQQPILLDLPAIWPCIKQLTLNRVTLTTATINNLHLHQLSELHTIKFAGRWTSSLHSAMDVAALQRLMQTGGLPALRTVICSEVQEEDALRLLWQLGPVLGHRVTELQVDNLLVLKAIRLWPALQRLEVQSGNFFGPLYDDHKAVKHIFEHPHLQEAVVPISVFNSKVSASTNKLGSLYLTGYAGPQLLYLHNIPLHAVQRLRFHTGVQTNGVVSSAAAQHLQQCKEIEILPDCWGDFSDRFDDGYECLSSDTPTWEVTFTPLLLNWVLPSLSKAEGALILYRHPDIRGQKTAGREHANYLALLPPGIHTVALDGCAVGGGLTWVQLVAHVPQHVRFLLLRRCKMTRAQFEAILAKPPPSGLRSISLAQDRHYMPWVEEHAEALEALMATKWPGVKLEQTYRESLEDFYEDKRARQRNTDWQNYPPDADIYGAVDVGF